MTIVVDANVAIAVLDPDDAHHRAAIRRCVEAQRIAILNITRAEALIHPTRSGHFEAADIELTRLGFETHPLDDPVADRARMLRADHGNRSFPMVDAVVVAFGIEHGMPVVTADRRWPAIGAATIEVLGGQPR